MQRVPPATRSIPDGLQISLSRGQDLTHQSERRAAIVDARELLKYAVRTHFKVVGEEVILHPARPSIAGRSIPAWAEILRDGRSSRPRLWLWTSLARTSHLIAAATSPTPVGVDIEELQSQNQADQLLSILHPLDRSHLSEGVSPQRELEITAAWARKEAVLKARGIGLSEDPRVEPVAAPESHDSRSTWRSLSATLIATPHSTREKIPLHALGIAWRARPMPKLRFWRQQLRYQPSLIIPNEIRLDSLSKVVRIP